MKLPIVVDFETEPIQPRPHYPPKPVSVAIWEPGRKPEFWAWGHPEGNNCTRAQARERLRSTWNSPRGVLFHEAKFDLDVAETHLGLRPPPWDRIHCSLLQLFLRDPNAPGLALKPACERYLDWPQEDQEPLRRWVLEHVPEARRRPSRWEAWIGRLPGHLAADRAVGDVKRTRALHEAFYAPSEPYDRERRLIGPLLAMERRGVPVDVAGLEQDALEGPRRLERLDAWVRRRLGAPALEVGRREQLADAIEDAGLLDEWILTEPSERHPEGTRSTAWEALREVCHDPVLVGALRYRGILQFQLRTVVEPWLAQARETGGRVYLALNPTRGNTALKGRQVGARTGRLSSTPNLQNVPGENPKLCTSRRSYERALQEGDAILVPLRGLTLLDPRARVVAPRGRALGDADYSQQELRDLAHGAGGLLAEQYRRDPRTDAHGWVAEMLGPITGRAWPKRHVKGVNFGVLYGEGVDKLAQKLSITREDARALRDACRRLLGAGDFSRDLQRQGYVVTIGGRRCPQEPDSFVRGQLRTWGYKLLNTYVQGSAADQMKEAMIQVEELGIVEPLLSVHDELLWEDATRGAKGRARRVADTMRDAMKLDVPMRVDWQIGKTWRDCK